MPARTAASLHITNGDSVLYLFKKAGILGTHIGWRDALHDGPVPHGLSLAEMSRLRADYLVMRGYGRSIKLYHEFGMRDAAISRASEFEEVVLWFEHDLFDQLQVAQVLVILDALKIEPGRVSIVQSGDYLGAMTAEEISALFPKRKTVTNAIYSAARHSWDALTSATPDALHAHTHIDSHGLPFMRAALRRLAQEYPDVDGLSRSQRQALLAVAQGPAKIDELFRRAQGREEAPFLGDLAFAAVLTDLQCETAALIEEEDAHLVCTALGRRILAGDADWIAEAGIDRWIGGVHLTPDAVVRYDDVTGAFQA